MTWKRTARGLFLTGCVGLFGCDGEPRLDVLEVYPPPRLAAVTVKDTGRIRYRATTQGGALATLEHRGRRARLELPVASGWLEVAADDARTLSGELEFDLSRLALSEAPPELDESGARRLLELDQGRLQQRASFRILSIPNAEVPQTRAQQGEARRHVVQLTARGELSLHGFRATREVELELEFELPTEPGAAPESVTVKTRRSLRLRPETFGIRPEPGDDTLAKLLDSAAVSAEARFLPQPK